MRYEPKFLGTNDVPSPMIELLRARISTIVLIIFFPLGGGGVECLTRDLVTTQQGGLILYHRDRKG
jgi:hypothetical protein